MEGSDAAHGLRGPTVSTPPVTGTARVSRAGPRLPHQQCSRRSLSLPFRLLGGRIWGGGGCPRSAGLPPAACPFLPWSWPWELIHCPHRGSSLSRLLLMASGGQWPFAGLLPLPAPCPQVPVVMETPPATPAPWHPPSLRPGHPGTQPQCSGRWLCARPGFRSRGPGRGPGAAALQGPWVRQWVSGRHPSAL